MSLYEGYSVSGADRFKIEIELKRDLPKELFEMSVCGHRALVGMDRADEMYKGLIQKPKSAIDAEQVAAGSGWVIAVGPLFGAAGAPHPSGVQCDDPRDMLGRHVYFQMWQGKVFRTDDDDEEFSGKLSLVLLTDRDIQGYDK